MTATQEISKWVTQHRKLQNDAEREAFYQSIIASLSKKNNENLADGLLALKETVKARRQAAELALLSKQERFFQVFPSSEEERELLKSLLERMNIPFKMSA